MTTDAVSVLAPISEAVAVTVTEVPNANPLPCGDESTVISPVVLIPKYSAGKELWSNVYVMTP
jgi:hypothetical protein